MHKLQVENIVTRIPGKSPWLNPSVLCRAEEYMQLGVSLSALGAGAIATTFFASPWLIIPAIGYSLLKAADWKKAHERPMTLNEAANTNLLRITACAFVPLAQRIARSRDRSHRQYAHLG